MPLRSGRKTPIYGIPLEGTDNELMEGLLKYGATFDKGLKRKTDEGFEISLSYLVCFKNKPAPQFINFFDFHIETRPYNPHHRAVSSVIDMVAKRKIVEENSVAQSVIAANTNAINAQMIKNASTATAITVLLTVDARYTREKRKYIL